MVVNKVRLSVELTIEHPYGWNTLDDGYLSEWLRLQLPKFVDLPFDTSRALLSVDVEMEENNGFITV